MRGAFTNNWLAVRQFLLSRSSQGPRVLPHHRHDISVSSDEKFMKKPREKKSCVSFFFSIENYAAPSKRPQQIGQCSTNTVTRPMKFFDNDTHTHSTVESLVKSAGKTNLNLIFSKFQCPEMSSEVAGTVTQCDRNDTRPPSDWNVADVRAPLCDASAADNGPAAGWRQRQLHPLGRAAIVATRFSFFYENFEFNNKPKKKWNRQSVCLPTYAAHSAPEWFRSAGWPQWPAGTCCLSFNAENVADFATSFWHFDGETIIVDNLVQMATFQLFENS